ncbi:MAG: CbiX/SirB N-terminal domain-containing protein [Rhodocyclaceae bacterium]|nr:CbiX/SirB N-terminal domain-containing protein [Rhodocyclaceae bacterium]
MNGIILFGHGARNAEYVEPFRRIQAAVARLLPTTPVELGFLELTEPALEASIASLAMKGVKKIRIVPIFFAPGRHVLKDLPLLLGNAMDRHAGIEFEIAECVGMVDEVIEAMARHAVRGA